MIVIFVMMTNLQCLAMVCEDHDNNDHDLRRKQDYDQDQDVGEYDQYEITFFHGPELG